MLDTRKPHVLFVSNHWGAKRLIPSAGIFVDRQISSLERAGAKISTFDMGLSHSPIEIIKKWLELRRLVVTLDPDLLHGRYGTIVGFVTAFAGKPTVISFCGGDLLLGASIPLFRQRVGVLLSNLAALRAKRLICVSEEIRQALWWRKNKTIVIPDGVDLEFFSPGPQETARRELGWAAHTPAVILNVRNDPKAKGLDLGKAAMRLVNLQLPDAALHVIENVAPNRMPLYYQAADVLLCLSVSEGSPNVVKEALACNLPVVSTPVGDVRERLAGVEPSEVVERNVERIAEALIQILQQRKRSNGREHAGRVCLENVAKSIMAVYQEALHEGSSKHGGESIPLRVEPSIEAITGEEMLKKVADLHLEAFAGYLNAQLGRGYAKAFIKWFSRRKGAIAIAVVDIDGKVIGYALGAPTGYGRVLNRELFWCVAVRVIVRPWLFLAPKLWTVLMARVRILFGSQKMNKQESKATEPSMSLVAIGVLSSERRMKIGQLLIETFESRARKSQMRSGVLSVYADRTSVRRFYEKCGWQPEGGQACNEAVIRYYKNFPADEISDSGTAEIDANAS